MSSVVAGDDDDPPSAAIRPSSARPRSPQASPENASQAPAKSGPPSSTTLTDVDSNMRDPKDNGGAGIMDMTENGTGNGTGNGMEVDSMPPRAPSVSSSSPPNAFRVIRVPEKSGSSLPEELPASQAPLAPTPAPPQPESSTGNAVPPKEEEEEEMDVQEEEEDTPPPMASMAPPTPQVPQHLQTTSPSIPPPQEPVPPEQDPRPQPQMQAPQERASSPSSPFATPPPQRAEPVLKPIPSPPWASDGFRPEKSPPPRTRGRGRGAARGRGRGLALGEKYGVDGESFATGRDPGNASGSTTRGRGSGLGQAPYVSSVSQQQFPVGMTEPVGAAMSTVPPPNSNHYPNSYSYPSRNEAPPVQLPAAYHNPYAHLIVYNPPKPPRAQGNSRKITTARRKPDEEGGATQAVPASAPQAQPQQQPQTSQSQPHPLAWGLQDPAPPGPIKYMYATPPNQTPYTHAPYAFSHFQVQQYQPPEPQLQPPPQLQLPLPPPPPSSRPQEPPPAPPVLRQVAPPAPQPHPPSISAPPAVPIQPARRAIDATRAYQPAPSSPRKRTRSHSPLPAPPPPPPWYTPAQAQAHAQAVAAPARGSMSGAVAPLRMGEASGSWSGAASSGVKRLRISKDLFSPSPPPSPATPRGGYVRRMRRSVSRERSRSRSREMERRSPSRNRSRGRSVSPWRTPAPGQHYRDENKGWSRNSSSERHPKPSPELIAPWDRDMPTLAEIKHANKAVYPKPKPDKGKRREQDAPPTQNRTYTRGRNASHSPMRVDSPPRPASRPDAHWTSRGRLPSPNRGLHPWPFDSTNSHSPPLPSSASNPPTVTASPLSASGANYSYDYAIEHSPPAPAHASLPDDVNEQNDGRTAYSRIGMTSQRPPYPPSPRDAREFGRPVHVVDRSRSHSPIPPDRVMRNMYIPPQQQAPLGMGVQTYAYLAMQPQPPPRAPVTQPSLAPPMMILQDDSAPPPSPPAPERPLRRSIASMAQEHAAAYASGQRPPTRLVLSPQARAEEDARHEADARHYQQQEQEYRRQQDLQQQYQDHQYRQVPQQQHHPSHPRSIPVTREMYADMRKVEKMEEEYRQQHRQMGEGSASARYQQPIRPPPFSREQQREHHVIGPSLSSSRPRQESRSPPPARGRALSSTHQHEHIAPPAPPPPPPPPPPPRPKPWARKNQKPQADQDRPDRVVSMRTKPQPPPQIVAQEMAAKLGIPMGSSIEASLPPPGTQGTLRFRNRQTAGSPIEGGSGPNRTNTGSGLGADTVLPPELQVGAHLQQTEAAAARLALRSQKAKHRKTQSAQSGDASSSSRTHKPSSSAPAVPTGDASDQQFGPLQHFQTSLFPQEHLLLDMHSVGGAQFVLKPPRNPKGGRGVYGSYGVVLDGVTGGSVPVNAGGIVGADSGVEASRGAYGGQSMGANGNGNRRSSGEAIDGSRTDPGEESSTLHNVLVVRRRRSTVEVAAPDPAIDTPPVAGGRIMTPPLDYGQPGYAAGRTRGRPRGALNKKRKGKEREEEKRESGSGSKDAKALGTAQAPLIISDEDSDDDTDDAPHFAPGVRVIRGPARSPDAPPIQVHVEVDSPSVTNSMPYDSDSEEEDELESEDSNGGTGYKHPAPYAHSYTTVAYMVAPPSTSIPAIPAPITELRRSTRTSSTSRSSSHARTGTGADGKDDQSAKKPRKKHRSVRIREPMSAASSSKVDTYGNTFTKPLRPSRKSKKYPCDVCDQIFTRSGDVRRHKDTRHNTEGSNGCVCSFCGRVLTRQDALQRHWEKYCRKKSERHLSRSRGGQASGMGVYGLMHRSYLDPLPHDTSSLGDNFSPENEEIRVAMAMATAMVHNVSAGGVAGPSTAASHGSSSDSRSHSGSAYGQQFLCEDVNEQRDDIDMERQEDEEDDTEDWGSEDDEELILMYMRQSRGIAPGGNQDTDAPTVQPSTGLNDNETTTSGVE